MCVCVRARRPGLLRDPSEPQLKTVSSLLLFLLFHTDEERHRVCVCMCVCIVVSDHLQKMMFFVLFCFFLV